MNSLLLPLSVLCGLVLAGTAISLFTLYRAHSLMREIKTRAETQQIQTDSGIQALRDTVDALAAQVHDIQSHPLVAQTPGMPKPGLNLNKRSHALRLYRRGEGAEHIATALELPRQEVDLLLKVHRIVLSNVS